ncbi:hypothetical protein [Cronobacter malonaticus]|uniref:hypothetical protein n=1 Tax=Cronobacter malonaticus TaxID=413503 RepID=UPI002893B7CF|nr:hypothetical protein [Cronobacter malonaticus]MDT3597014.1 hypothetical protein [Cronobacter malonaticus]
MTFTKEQLIAAAHGRIDFANMMLSDNPEPLKERTWSIELELARIALSALRERAEPVAYIIQDAEARDRGLPGFLSYDASINDEDINEYEISVTPLYTAPPAPVVPKIDRKAICNKVHWLCARSPGATFYNAAEFALDEVMELLAPPAPVVTEGLRIALSNAGIAAPESDEMLWASQQDYIQMLVTWVKDRKPFKPASVLPVDVLAALRNVAKIRLDFNDFDGDRRGMADCLGEAEEALTEVVNRRAAMIAAPGKEG